MRVVTLKLWGQRGDWAGRRRMLAGMFGRLDADLIAFQQATVADGVDAVRDILGDGFDVAHQRDRDDDGRGVAIASRYPITGSWEVDLAISPRTRGFAATTLIAQIVAPPPFGPLLFANHLPNWQLNFERERELQAVAAACELEGAISARRQHVVVAGDLDADPDAASIRFWTGRESLAGVSVSYRDAWASTHPAEPGDSFGAASPQNADWDWPFRRIDYILVRCGEDGGPTLAVSSCERVFDQPADGAWAGDHFGLCADLAIPRSNREVPPLPLVPVA